MKVPSGALLLGISLLALLGCSQGPQLPKPVEVSGTVNLDGKPMPAGEVCFYVEGQPPVPMPVTDGAFSGKAFVGPNTVGVIWDQDGPPHPMDPSQRMKINTVDARFLGPSSPLKHDVPATGAKDLKFEVTSARR
jgi:hypothetical protein